MRRKAHALVPRGPDKNPGMTCLSQKLAAWVPYLPIRQYNMNSDSLFISIFAHGDFRLSRAASGLEPGPAVALSSHHRVVGADGRDEEGDRSVVAAAA